MGGVTALLPQDWRTGSFLGRVEAADGPAVVLIRQGRISDVTRSCPTASMYSSAVAADSIDMDVDAAFDAGWTLRSPLDLHCVKAAGVTFAVSAIERVIEERARGDLSAASDFRAAIEARVGRGIRTVIPGSDAADALKAVPIEEGLWSQYLKVAIGPDAEIFTKSPILSTVGAGAPIGVRSDSTWNNPEPEVVLVVDPAGRPIGATLGNDVNLRDFEGRSALLLGKAKDNRASCAVGPFIRLFDDDFTMDDVRSADVDLLIEGEDGFRLAGVSNMSEISRDPEELVRQTLSEHDYPDGFALFLGTLFAPVQDRDTPGHGFTHKAGDRVTISSARLGSLTNTVAMCADAPPWTFGVTQLMRNLAGRGLLSPAR